MPFHDVEIVPYRDDFASAFSELNRRWLEANDLIEATDLPFLEHPRESIIEAGGAILCAVQQGSVVGTVAIMRLGSDVYELAKLAVAPAAQGQGLGRQLTWAAVELATSLGGRRIVLSSNSRLTAALRLYQSIGFRPAEPADGAASYATADIYMALDL